MRHLLMLTFFLLLLSPAARADDKTRLKATNVEGVFKNYGGRMIRLTNVQATVKNIGSYTAENIRVNATLPDGSVVKLRGPSSLDKYKEAVFTRSVSAYVTSQKKIQATATCDNCR